MTARIASMIDAESEYEGKYVAAQSYITQLRKLIGQSFPVALAGFPYVDYHPGFPYSVFLGPGGAQYNTPQMYWVDIGTSVNTVYAHTYAYNAVYQRAIDPLGQVYAEPATRAAHPLPPAVADLRRRRRLAGGTGSRRPRPAGRGSRSAPATSPASPPPPSTPILKLHSLGDLVVWAQEHLATAGYTIPIDGDYGPNTQSAVESFQTAKGLTADGIVGPGYVGCTAALRPGARDLDAHRARWWPRPRRCAARARGHRPTAHAGAEVGARARQARRDRRRRRRWL